MDEANGGGHESARSGVRRRSFLGWAAATAGALAYPSLDSATDEADAAVPDSGGPSYVVGVRRADDQCVLLLSFYNLAPDFTQSPPVITQLDSTATNYLVVEFGHPDASIPALDAAAPQHVTEHAFPLQGGELGGVAQQPAPTPPPTTSTVVPPPVGARLSGPSRVVFRVPPAMVAPAATEPWTLTTEDLLQWVQLGLSVVPNAIGSFGLTGPSDPGPKGLGPPIAPNALQTAIELPYGIVISPPGSAYREVLTENASIFVNATAPVTHNGWTELWHTRLGARRRVLVGSPNAHLVEIIDEDDRDYRLFRAVWCTDPTFAADVAANTPHPSDGLPPFRSALTYQDRYDIVRLSSDFTPDSSGGPYRRPGNGLFVPSPATADKLMLSSLGGWLDSEAHWDLPAKPSTPGHRNYNSSLLAWRHRAVQGRDAYVRVVRKGFLFPWGHRASLITITEREPTNTGGTVGAYLRQKTFIVVSGPTKKYGRAGDFVQYGGRRIPFTSVEAITLTTPDVDAPQAYINGVDAKLVFEPTINTQPFRFHFRGTDWAGDHVDFRSPVVWVDDLVAYGGGTNASIIAKLRTTWHDSHNTIDLHSKRVSLAEPKDPTKVTGDTALVVADFELGSDKPTSGTTATQLAQASQPAFYPALVSATIRTPEAGTASGHAVDPSTFEYEPLAYLKYGFAPAPDHSKPNKGGIFLRRVPSVKRSTIAFASDHSGGAITPNLGVDGYSREIGPASGDLANIARLALGTFAPEAVFANVNARLLGGLELQTILRQVSFGDGDGDGNAQALQLTSVQLTDPDRIVTTLDWHPVIQNGGPTLPGGHQITVFEVQNPDAGGASSDSMDLHAVIVTDLSDPTKSTTTVSGQIRAFNLDLFGNDPGTTFFIQIPFDSLTFHARTGQKTAVDVVIGDSGVQFQGALSFVQTLADYLSFGGSGLTINTAGEAITAELTLAIPSIPLGLFALENLAFSAGVAIPYNGDPVRVTFGFSSRENPFQLEVMCFTGGGYVGLGLGVDGVELLEFGFDFGLGISINIGIASGQVSLVGGMYFEVEKKSNGKQTVDLTAYVKASGGISALGIVSVSVELYLGMNYHDPGGVISGDAEMTISVHILFFGGDVGFSVHEEFAGASAAAKPQLQPADRTDNTFGSSTSLADWEEYCTSFALLGV